MLFLIAICLGILFAGEVVHVQKATEAAHQHLKRSCGLEGFELEHSFDSHHVQSQCLIIEVRLNSKLIETHLLTQHERIAVERGEHILVEKERGETEEIPEHQKEDEFRVVHSSCGRCSRGRCIRI